MLNQNSSLSSGWLQVNRPGWIRMESSEECARTSTSSSTCWSASSALNAEDSPTAVQSLPYASPQPVHQPLVQFLCQRLRASQPASAFGQVNAMPHMKQTHGKPLPLWQHTMRSDQGQHIVKRLHPTVQRQQRLQVAGSASYLSSQPATMFSHHPLTSSCGQGIAPATWTVLGKRPWGAACAQHDSASDGSTSTSNTSSSSSVRRRTSTPCPTGIPTDRAASGEDDRALWAPPSSGVLVPAARAGCTASPQPVALANHTGTATAAALHTNTSHCLAVPSLPSPSYYEPPCSPDLLCEEFIHRAARALQLCPHTTARLAAHTWRRVSGMVRLVLSIRRPAMDRSCAEPWVATNTRRVYATACLWLAAKLEEQRREAPSACSMAIIAKTSPGVLCAIEVRLLSWVEWSPMRGYLGER